MISNKNSKNQKKPNKKKFRLKSMRLWQLIAVLACVGAIVFGVLWSQQRGLNQDLLEQLHEAETILPIEIDEDIIDELTTDEQLAVDMDVSGVSLKGKRIIIDPGHGGDVPGGTTGVSGKEEKDVNLEISEKLQTQLQNEGVEVVMTREDDNGLGDTWEADMQAREDIVKQSDADMFISIHQNEFEDPAAKGPQVFFVAQGSIGKRLAVCVQNMINYELDIDEPRIPLEAALRVLRVGSQPSCTVECGFMSNPEEDLLLQEPDYQEEMAGAILNGIKLYVKKHG